jgi:putative ABC transport system ATP-binding protein
MLGTSPLLEFERVSRTFNGRRGGRVLEEVCFAVERGEQVCVAGPSGSGKTTLLNLAGGLLEPTSGSISVEGRRLEGLSGQAAASRRARELGFVFQSPNLIPVLTAAENIDFGLHLARPELSNKERRKLVDAAMEATRITSIEGSRPADLSGGEAQRVAIARAIVKRPKLLLADEPTSHLDDANCEQICDLFAGLRSGRETAVVIATHDSRILRHAHRVLAICEGYVTEAARPQMPKCYVRG